MHYAPIKIFQKPVWVLCHWRSGSYYLTNLLNTTNLFHPTFDEWLRGGYDKNTEYWKRPWPPYRKKPNAEKEWLLKHLPPYTKLFYVNYASLGLTNQDSRPIADIYLPGIRFILLRRRDQIGTAVSFYIAKKTKYWFVSSREDVRKQAKTNVPIDYCELLEIYNQTLTWWNQWDGFLEGHKYLDVYYEDLVADTSEVDRILEYLDVHKEVFYKYTTMKNRHPQTPQIRTLLEEAITKGDVVPPTIQYTHSPFEKNS